MFGLRAKTKALNIYDTKGKKNVLFTVTYWASKKKMVGHP